MHFHERIIAKKINIGSEIGKILEVFFTEEHYFGSFMAYMSAAKCIDINYFRKTKCSQSYLHIDDCYSDLRIKNENPKIDDLILTYEFIFTILFQSVAVATIEDSDSLKSVLADVRRIINNVLDKIGYKANVIKDDKFGNIICITSADALVEEAIEEINSENLSFNLIEYRSNLCKGNLKRKKEILANLANYVEPLLKDPVIKIQRKDLADDVGFMLNNLEIRHNNTEINNQFIKKIGSALEEWYDKTFQYLLLLIVAKKEISIHNDIEILKKK